MWRVIVFIVGAIIALLVRFAFKVSNSNFYIAFVGGALLMLYIGFFVDWEKRKKQKGKFQ